MQRQSNPTTDNSSRGRSFSLFPKVTARKPVGVFSLPELERWIRSNEPPAAAAHLRDVYSETNAIRAHYRQNGKDSYYQEKKKDLPAFTPAGLFSRRNRSGLEKHSGCIPVDFDDLPAEERKAALLEQLQQLPFISLAALSVADGMWALAAVDPAPATAQEHTTAWRAVVDAIQDHLVDTQVDRSGKDLARARYLAADPNVYVNHDAVPLAWLPIRSVRPPRPSVGTHALPPPAEVDMMLRHIDPDCDRTTWIKIGAALRREGYDLLLWRNWSAQGQKFDPATDCTQQQWDGFADYDGREARIGTIVKLAREGGYTGHPLGAFDLRAEMREETDPGALFPSELNRIHEKLSELHHVRRMLERHAPDLLSAVDVDTRTLYVLQGNGIWLPGDDQVRRLYWATASHWLRQVVEHRDLLPSLIDNDKAFTDTVKAFRATERNRACKEGIQLAGSMIAHWEKAGGPACGVPRTHCGEEGGTGRGSALSRLRKRRRRSAYGGSTACRAGARQAGDPQHRCALQFAGPPSGRGQADCPSVRCASRMASVRPWLCLARLPGPHALSAGRTAWRRQIDPPDGGAAGSWGVCRRPGGGGADPAQCQQRDRRTLA